MKINEIAAYNTKYSIQNKVQGNIQRPDTLSFGYNSNISDEYISKKPLNKGVIIGGVAVLALGALAFAKRKDIGSFVSGFLNKNTIDTKTPPIPPAPKPLPRPIPPAQKLLPPPSTPTPKLLPPPREIEGGNIEKTKEGIENIIQNPITNIPPVSASKITREEAIEILKDYNYPNLPTLDRVRENMAEPIQFGPKGRRSLNSGYVFWGMDSIGKRELFSAFVQEQKDKGYRVFEVPTLEEAGRKEMHSKLTLYMNAAKKLFKRKHVKSIIIVPDLDKIGVEENLKNLPFIRTLLYRGEESTRWGYHLFLEAKDVRVVDGCLIRIGRASTRVLLPPSIDDSLETIEKFSEFLNTYKWAYKYRPYIDKLLELKKGMIQ